VGVVGIPTMIDVEGIEQETEEGEAEIGTIRAEIGSGLDTRTHTVGHGIGTVGAEQEIIMDTEMVDPM